MDLQPAIFYGGVTMYLNSNVFETLVDYGADGLVPEPKLAKKWALSEDGAEVTLTLQEGVTFHSGREFTSADVEYSLKAAADPANGSPLARTAAVVTGFDTTDPGVAKLTLDHPVSNLFDLLANTPIIDKDSYAGIKDGSKYIGTGPFTFESWKPGTGYSLVRNDAYWGEKASLDEVTFKVIPDPQALTSQLRAGQIDVVVNGSTRDAEALKAGGKFDVDVVEGASGTFLGTNVNNPALKDVKVRQAIAYAIDRERIVEEVYLGYGTPGALPWDKSSPAFSEELNETYAFDLKESAALLEAAGVDDGQIKGLPLAYASENPASGAVAQIIQADLASIGIDVKLDPKPAAELNKLGAAPGGIEGLWLNGHIWTVNEPSTLPVTAFAFNSVRNISGYVDPTYQKAAEEAWTSSPEDAAESGVYTELAEALLAGAFVDEIAVSNSVRLRNADVNGIVTTKSISLGLADATNAE